MHLLIKFKDCSKKHLIACKMFYENSQIHIETKDEILFFDFSEIESFAIVQ